MTTTDLPRRLVDIALDSCRAALDATGECRNLATFARAGAPLMTVLYGYPDPDPSKKVAVSMLLGRAALALDADLLVMVSDTWRVDMAPEAAVAWAEDTEAPPVRDLPERTEALEAHVVTPAGLGWRWLQPYGRDDTGQPVWGVVVEETEGEVQSRILDAVQQGWRPRGPKPQLAGVLANMADLLGTFPIVPLDPAVAVYLASHGFGRKN